MGWTISVNSKGLKPGVTISLSGTQWRFIPNAAIPAWQAQGVCQHILSTLVGFD